MSTINILLQTITQSIHGLTLAELLTHHPEVARRTAQRWISQLIAEQRIMAVGQGRARRYYAVSAVECREKLTHIKEKLALKIDPPL